MTQYWSAVQTHPRSEPDVRRDIEDVGIGTFLPSYAQYFYRGSQLRERRKALLTGYVFVALEDNDGGKWRDIEHIEGVNRVLMDAGKPGRIAPEEMSRLVIAHAQGRYNAIQPRSAAGRYTKRRRRPRPGKVQRAALRQAFARTRGL